MVSNKKPNVLVTGSAGLLGSAVCDLLAASEIAFQTLDLNPKAHPGSKNHFIGLATDQQLAQQAMAGVDAVIHLAAIRNPNYGTPVAVFSNALATFNILDAASAANISRAVIASSFSATGLPFATKEITIDQLPIDENFANQITDPYALSKNIDELTAQYMNTRFGMRVVAIRYPYIGDHVELLPKRFAQFAADPALGKKELWTYIDTRDAAYVAVDSILNDEITTGSYFVTAANLLGPNPAADLVGHHFGLKLPASHGKYESLVSFAKAKIGLKFEPQHNYPNELT